jgi:hypothetical protein
MESAASISWARAIASSGSPKRSSRSQSVRVYFKASMRKARSYCELRLYRAVLRTARMPTLGVGSMLPSFFDRSACTWAEASFRNTERFVSSVRRALPASRTSLHEY